ncbi:hypothetical protein DFH07DRAFT_737496 [Mycena maculata]|uniref:Uncharacterized protein n=1 Tax=Mycena maculata TaxID=230809 RepID=A0AAD7NM46_9AGAR|nr:hypothetical protein DFH07DRAFT_737496 [Mycena maculata]
MGSFTFFFSLALCLVVVSISPLVAAHAHGHSQHPGRNVASATEIQLPALTLRSQATAFTFDLESALPPATSTSAPLSVLPSACAGYEGPGNECTANMTAASVTFEDCGTPFTVCRCTDANMTMATVVDRLGRVPVGLRRFVGAVMILGGETQAYTNLSTGDIHMFGVTEMDTWVHEATHAFDFAVPTAPHSNSTRWTTATSQDSCAPDDYSLTNRVEDFAQMSVMKVYMLLHNGNLPPGFQSGCMSNQLNFMSTLPLYNATRLFGNTCHINDALPGVRCVFVFCEGSLIFADLFKGTARPRQSWTQREPSRRSLWVLLPVPVLRLKLRWQTRPTQGIHSTRQYTGVVSLRC